VSPGPVHMEHVVNGCAKLDQAEFFDVGWGSNVALCRQALPHAFFSLRLSPVRLKVSDVEQVRQDVEHLLQQAGPLEKTAMCCINVDYDTPDENIRRWPKNIAATMRQHSQSAKPSESWSQEDGC
jgi:hypothetical protein